MKFKRICAFFFTFAILTVLTACGGKDTPANSSGRTTEYVEHSDEGEVQSGIKPDEDFAEPTEDTEQSEEASELSESEQPNNAEIVDNESGSSGNFEDYWEGDDYFDLESYLKDRNCDYFAPTNGSDHTEISSGATAYFALFNNQLWEIYINPSSGCTLAYQKADSSGHTQAYIVYDDLGLDQHMVTVNTQGTQLSEGTLVVMDTIINAIQDYPDDLDPMQYFDLRYVPYTM